MKNLYFCILFLAGALARAGAQDYQFSQYFASPILVNPAATGHFQAGNTRLAVQYRNQWSDAAYSESAYSGANLSLDFRQCTGRNFWAAGVVAHREQSGLADFYQQRFLASAAYHIALDRQSRFLAAGAYIGALNYGLDLSGLRFDEQWDGSRYNMGFGRREALVASRWQADMGAGFQYYQNPQGRLQYSIGAALHHLNQPIYSLMADDQIENNANDLGIGFALHAALNPFTSDRLRDALTIRLLAQRQSFSGNNSQQWQLVPGLMARLRFSKNRALRMAFGLSARFAGRQRASDNFPLANVIPMIQLGDKQWQWTFSYDVNTSPLVNRFAGGFESTFSYIFGTESGKKCINCPGY